MALNDKTFQPLLKLKAKAADEIPAFRFIDFDGGLLAANSKSFGVSEVAANLGDNMSIITHGTAIIETSGSIALGAAVTSDTGGKAKAVATNEPVNGRALTAITGAGFITILLVN